MFNLHAVSSVHLYLWIYEWMSSHRAQVFFKTYGQKVNATVYDLSQNLGSSCFRDVDRINTSCAAHYWNFHSYFWSHLSKWTTSNNFLFGFSGEWTLHPAVILRWFLVDKDKWEVGDTSKISIYICVNEA